MYFASKLNIHLLQNLQKLWNTVRKHFSPEAQVTYVDAQKSKLNSHWCLKMHCKVTDLLPPPGWAVYAPYLKFQRKHYHKPHERFSTTDVNDFVSMYFLSCGKLSACNCSLLSKNSQTFPHPRARLDGALGQPDPVGATSLQQGVRAGWALGALPI